ncbi:hypothetical protein AMJ50_01730 [Parcubacteria bacterium DG_74_3]|nr:MAG: hypothetical protein AMJ50_01730 [Parcubacteria bacterium DG_74_3]
MDKNPNAKKKTNKSVIFVLLSLVSCLLFLVWYGIYLPKSFSSREEMAFLVKRGDNLFQIAERLEELGLIKNRFFFTFYVILKGEQRKLQAGEYFFSPGMSISEISQKIISGDVIKEKITIIEGWNLRDVAWYFENLGMFQAEELFELIGFPLIDYSVTEELPTPKDFSDEFGFLEDKPKNVNLEGYLFPDTYQINRGETLETIVKKMLDNFDKKLTADLREEIKIQEKSIFEIITMASLLEKEVKTPEEKKLVSGILWKRLANNIPLQVDATLNYITGEKTIKVSKEDTEIDSPYNTYKYKGLPLGPICNPGLESILAAIYPEDSFYWFYLSIPGGETIFSKNYEEHNLAKAKYLK